ncbi:MAG: peptidase M16 [Desulfuromonas sp.]|uniref:M16 family metallopeptidase n=1 Tax=Desulfuromonas sp. TaxID=892 RepID=UPI000CB9B90C|nr:pitrilysin family protein [Desulfuromonas sp.]PLX84752.1 MAG: peptidase M16 [Desulfuromonas sp.]
MVQSSTLENGIRVVTEQISAAHSVAIGFWVESGSRHEKLSENGISHFVEHMLFKGTDRRSAQDIAREIDSVGGVLNAFTGREFSCYFAKVLAKKLPLAIDLLSDIVLASVFDPDEIEKERRVILQEIHMVEDTPEDLVHDLFSQSFWEGHPLGLSVLGTADTVGRISREGLLGYMSERYCGKSILISAAGDLVHQDIVDEVAAAFSRVPAGSERPLCPLHNYRRCVGVVEKDLEQVHLCLGTRALPQNHPKRFAAHILNTLLGGSMSSRLFQTVREERGLAYSIYSYLHGHTDAGGLVIYAGTAPEDASEVVNLVLRELRRLKRETVSDEELRSAKEQLKGNLMLSMESTDSRMTRLAKNEIYLGKYLSLREVLRGFDRVTREDLRDLADYMLQDEYLNLQLLGRVRESEFPSDSLNLS